MIFTPNWKIQFFEEKTSQNFSTLHQLPSEHEILTTVAPNRTRSGLLETRHSELSRHINFEENRARKGLQTAVQISGQKSKKDEIG